MAVFDSLVNARMRSSSGAPSTFDSALTYCTSTQKWGCGGVLASPRASRSGLPATCFSACIEPYSPSTPATTAVVMANHASG